MRAVIQAVSSASVRVNGGEPRPIGPGLVILLGVKDTDTLDIVPKLAEKCAGLRIFKDENDKLNLSAKDLGYSALVVSQFTLYGDTKKGFRPSFIKAARPPLAVDAYELFLAEMNKQGLKDVQHGEFGADMQVSLVNEGPYTNSFLLISDAGNAVVIDPAAEVQEYDKILKEHGGKLSLILCTHGHYDHVGSAGVLSREWGAKLYCEPADCRGTQLLPLKGSDSGYEEGEVIPLDELSFTVWHTPGHTEGSVVLLCENYLFVGDTVFQGSIGRTDLEGGDSRKMDESLRKFAALPVPAEAQVLPGHGDFSTFGQETATNFYIKNALRNA